MAFVIADRVRETSTTTGTGNFTLAGAVDRFRTFDSVLDTGDTTYYTIADQSGVGWEVGIATFTSPATLARTTILSSSNGGSAVDFGAGSKDVFITLPASRTVTSVDGGSTGLTPSTASYGAISLGGTLVAANGGTGQSSYTIGDLLYASGTTALSKLADVATGNALISGGVGTAPSWGKIGLTTHVSGTLPVANGGTGTTTAFTAGSVVFAGASGVYSQDNSNLFWDDSNNRLGVGTATPVSSIETNGTITAPTLAATNLKHASSASNNIVLDSGGNATFAGTPVPGSSFLRNHLINGNFGIAQRGTSFVAGANNDDTYNLDRWYILSDGNDAVDITQSTTEIPSNGSQTSIALDVETANKKFGVTQIIEQRNCQGLIGNTVTLSFKAKVSSTTKLDNVKAAIIAWSGTADTITSDIISAWNVEGTNPTLIANATYENSPANLNVTTSWATYSVSAAVDTASTSNIIVFIWSDVTDTTTGDFLYLTDVQLEYGTATTPFERRQYGQELALCQRYYQKGSSTLPGFSFCTHWLKVTMRTAPTMTGTSGATLTTITVDKFRSDNGATIADFDFTASAEL
jgi:hypothetical protein